MLGFFFLFVVMLVVFGLVVYVKCKWNVCIIRYNEFIWENNVYYVLKCVFKNCFKKWI